MFLAVITYPNAYLASITPKSINPTNLGRENKKSHKPRPRPVCVLCNQSFSRPSDLERHMKKHQPGAKQDHGCHVIGCHFSSYRKDKLADHIKARHS